MMPWCTYKTFHPSGLYYLGKGKTEAVQAGKYTGSGIRFRLAQTHPEYPPSSWSTCILETFATEEEAYAAEEVLVPLSLLCDPMILNMHQGGLKGRFMTPGKLLQMIGREKRAERNRIKKEKANLRKIKEKAKIKELKQRLKEK